MVPIKEMTDVLHVAKAHVGLRPKQWVRLKRGNVFLFSLANGVILNNSSRLSSILHKLPRK